MGRLVEAVAARAARLHGEARGQGMAEYAIIVAVIAIAAMAALGLFEDQLSQKFGELGATILGA